MHCNAMFAKAANVRLQYLRVFNGEFGCFEKVDTKLKLRHIIWLAGCCVEYSSRAFK
jgi:hypothetical protein